MLKLCACDLVVTCVCTVMKTVMFPTEILFNNCLNAKHFHLAVHVAISILSTICTIYSLLLKHAC